MKKQIFRQPKLVFLLTLVASAMLVLAACSPAFAGSSTAPAPTASPTPSGSSADPKPGFFFFSMENLGRLSPDTVILELAYEPTFFRIESSYVYGRPPVFDLLADGRVIYTQEGATYADERIMLATLSPQEVSALLKKVTDDGIFKLESFTDFCKTLADGTQNCLADAAYTILRLRIADGSLKEVKIYGDFANNPAAFTAITGYLTSYTHPAAVQYVPNQAAMFLSKNAAEAPAGTKIWPLDLALLQFTANDQGIWATVLEGQSLSKYLSVVGSNVGDTFFEADGTVYRAYLVPWLPGIEYAAQLHNDFPAP